MIFLGLVQGLTEFLPVSSSGHLVLVEHFIRVKASGATLEVALHGGTLVSVLVYYRKRLWALVAGCGRFEKESLAYVTALAVGTVPALAVYLLFKKRIEAAFDSPHVTALMLCGTGLIVLSLLLARKSDGRVTLFKALLVGLAQAVALLPGISRSGSTIVAARHLGIAPEEAAEFSFMLSIPAMCGALLFKGLEARREGIGDLHALPLACGVLIAAVSGYFAIKYLIKILSAGKAWMFGVYCLVVGIVGVAALWPR